MNIWTYAIIATVLLSLELVYFKIADKCNIIDKPNERSSHSTIVLRGGGVIFAISILVWYGWQILVESLGFLNEPSGIAERIVEGQFRVMEYLPFVIGLLLIAGVSFWDDVHSLPDSTRLVVQFIATALMLWSINLVQGVQDVQGAQAAWYCQVVLAIVALIVFVGATDVINFMDGINGITAGYSLAVLIPLLLIVDGLEFRVDSQLKVGEFIEPSYLIVAIIGVLVFSIFNFRSKGRAKCFAGDVGSIGIAFIMLFAIGRLMVQTGDVTYMIFLLVYGIDGCCTILHRIMLHENLGEAHRKHAYQLMCNELKIGHVSVSLLYMFLQLAVSLGFIYLCPNTVLAHWIYLIAVGIVLAGAYVLFMRKYYHLHQEYLDSLNKVKN